MSRRELVDVPRALRPFVWALATVWLPFDAFGRGLGRALGGHEALLDAIGRALQRAARALGRGLMKVLGPVGRWFRRVLAPVGRWVRRVYDRVVMWLVLWITRPLGRLGRWLVARCRPAAEAVARVGRSVARRMRPALLAFTGLARAVERSSKLVRARIRKWTDPIRRAVRSIR